MKNINIHHVCLLINDILKKHNINLQIKEWVDLYFDIREEDLKYNRDKHKLLPSDKINEYLAVNQFCTINTTGKTFYHYLPKLEFLEKILLNKEIRLYNLNKYRNTGDKTEYQYFLRTFGVVLPNPKEQILYFKHNSFIWCLTNIPADITNHKHWRKYANRGRGVAISLEIDFNSKDKGSVNLVNVCYQLDFLKEIQEKLKKEFNLQLPIINYLLFAKFYKKNCYSWEYETRLCIDKTFGKIDIPELKGCNGFFNIQYDKGNYYISVPLHNSFFKIDIKEIFCTQEQYIQIKHLIDKNKIKWVEKPSKCKK